MDLRAPPRFSVRPAPRVRPGLTPEEISEALSDLLVYAAELDSFLTQFTAAVHGDIRTLDERLRALEERVP